MGSTVTKQENTVTATPEERALNAQNLKMLQFMEPFQKQNYSAWSNNIQAILTGGTPDAKGIGGVDELQTQEMVNSSMRSMMPQFQSQGLMDSGSAMQAGVRAASDIRNANAQFNVSAAQNLFNLAVGGQSNLQGQGTQLSSVLGSQLAGLRTTNSKQSVTKAWGDYAMEAYKATTSAVGTAIGCWVAAEIFGGWEEYDTVLARYYINCLAPKGFLRFYMKYGERIAKFISNKPVFKWALRPIFLNFVRIAEAELGTVKCGVTIDKVGV